MKNLHPKVQQLKERTAGEYLTCRYTSKQAPDQKVGAEVDDRVIKGYLAVFGIRDSYGTRAIKGCFEKSIRDRGPESKAKNKIIHLYYHKIDEPVASYRVLREDDYGLYFEGVVDDVGGRAEQVLRQTRSGTLNQYSYGFDYVWDKMEYNEKTDSVDMYECALFEGSSLALKASMPETYSIRNAEDLNKALLELGLEAEDILQALPKKQQMEMRQLVTQYKSLITAKPLETRSALDMSKPIQKGVVVVGDYKIDLNQFKK